MTSTTGNNDVSTPLLCNLPEQESAADAYDVEECCMPCSLKINADDDKEESDDDSSQCTWWCDNFVTLVVLKEELDDDSDDKSQSAFWCDTFASLVVIPALLFLSFGEAFCTSSIAADTGLRWYMVSYSIVMFVVSATLYRQVLQECKITCLVALLLLPEILTDIVLYLMLFGKILPAFLLMLISTLFFAAFVVASSVGVLIAAPTMMIYITKGDCDEVSQSVQTA
jgi:hypothetical protein